MILAGLLLAAASFTIAAICLPLLEKRARESGLVDLPGGRRTHLGALPKVGGIAVLLAVAIPSVFGCLSALATPGSHALWPEAIAPHLEGLRTKSKEVLLILACAAVHLVLGHVDDRRSLSPWLRLSIECLAAWLLTTQGIVVTAFLPTAPLQAAATIAFLVFVTNAVNFIDNMNGLMGGTLLIAAVHLLGPAIATGQLFVAAILICVAASLLAFLPRNYPNARAIMGDAGSLSLGFLFGAIVIVFTFVELRGERTPMTSAVIGPMLVLALPLADGLTVVTSRLRRGVHPFTAGRDHLSHRLVDRGWSPKNAVVLLWVLAFIAGLPLAMHVPIKILFAIWPVPLLALALLWRQRVPS